MKHKTRLNSYLVSISVRILFAFISVSLDVVPGDLPNIKRNKVAVLVGVHGRSQLLEEFCAQAGAREVDFLKSIIKSYKLFKSDFQASKLTCSDIDLATTERILSRTSLESFWPLELALSLVNQVLCSSALGKWCHHHHIQIKIFERLKNYFC